MQRLEYRTSTSFRAPVEPFGELAQASLEPVVLEGALHSGLERVARVEPEALRRRVVPAEIGVEHRGIVGRDGAEDAGLDESRERMLLERAHGPGSEVRDRAGVE